MSGSLAKMQAATLELDAEVDSSWTVERAREYGRHCRRMQAGFDAAFLRRQAEEAHATTAEILLRLAAEIEKDAR